MTNEEYEKQFDGIPETPERVLADVRKSFSDYLLFETVKRGSRMYLCTHCGKTFYEGEREIREEMCGEDFALWHAEHRGIAACPKCGKDETVFNIRVGNAEKLHEMRNIAVFLPVSRNDVWIRCYMIQRCYERYRSECSHSCKEIARYHLVPGKAEFWKKYDYNGRFCRERVYEDPFVWNHGLYTEKYTYDLVTCGTEIDGTFLKYSGFKYAMQHHTVFPMIRYLCHYARHPQIEMLSKMGHTDLLRDVIWNNNENTSVIDWNAKTPWALYRISKQEYNGWIGYNSRGDLRLLKVYKRIRGKGKKDFEAAKNMIDQFERYSGYRVQKVYHFIALARKLKADPRDICRYISKVARDSGGGCHMCPGITEYEAATLWLDYIDLAAAAGMLRTVSPMPKDLKTEHDRLLKHKQSINDANNIAKLMKRIKAVRSEAKRQAEPLEKKYRTVRTKYAKLKPKYEFSDDKYMIVLPSCIADIIVEGDILGHCISRVERYYDRIRTDESYIMFLRKASAPDVPYYTLEVEPGGAVRQKRTFGDHQNADINDATEFLKKWQAEIQKRMTASDRRLAAKAKGIREEEFKELRRDKVQVRNGYLRGKYLADVLEADLLDIEFSVPGNKVRKKKETA